MHPRFLIVLLLSITLAATSRAAEFVGAEACRACHAAAYEAWKDSPHARAAALLTAEQQKDGRCVQCHAKDTALGGDAGVTCETCHGAGGNYWPNYVMRDAELARATGLVLPDARSCVACHDATSPTLEPFNAADKMKRIDHWTASRAARQKAGKKADNCPRTSPRAERGFLAQVLRSRTHATVDTRR